MVTAWIGTSPLATGAKLVISTAFCHRGRLHSRFNRNGFGEQSARENLHSPHAVACCDVENFTDLILLKRGEEELAIQLNGHSMMAFIRYVST